MYYTVFQGKILHDFVNKMDFDPICPTFSFRIRQKRPQTFSVRLEPFEFALSQNLVNGDRRAVGKIQTSLVRKHGNTHTVIEMRRRQLLGQSLRFFSENEINFSVFIGSRLGI